MSFLSLWMLWGLPLASLPVIIHLVNRMRHRTVEWAAMRFLQKVTRASTSMAKVRQWLVLLLRVLACAALILALARPLLGGLLGLRFSGAPDTIVLLLDRSASMQARGPGGKTILDSAVRRAAESASVFGGGPRMVLIDSNDGKPAQLPKASLLPELPIAVPGDGAAAMPAMLSAAIDYLTAHPAGSAEIWIVSDRQATGWQLEDKAWPLLESRIKGMRNPPRLRFLDASGAEASGKDAALSLLSVRTGEVPGSAGRKWRHEVAFVLRQGGEEAGERTLTLYDGANRSQVKVEAAGSQSRHRTVFETDALASPRAAYLELPADANPGNNRIWFALGKPPAPKTLIIGEAGDPATHLFALASKGEVVSLAGLRAGDLRDAALVVWNAALPAAELRKELDALVESGGTLLLLPTEKDKWDGLVDFGEAVASTTPLRIGQWERAEGPFADSDAGASLSMDRLEVIRRAALRTAQGAAGGEQPAPLALFADGTPMAWRLSRGQGAVVALATSPDPAWSNLRMGGVFIPFVRRLQADGARRFAPARYAQCGTPGCPDLTGAEPLAEGMAPGNAGIGVYRTDSGLVCVNRPAVEDDLMQVSVEATESAMKTVPMRAFQAKAEDDGAMQSEIWRGFLVLMLLLLAAEAFLLVPRAVPTGKPGAAKPGTAKGGHL